MADTPTTTVARAWASTTSVINNLRQQLDTEPGNRRAIEDRLADAEDQLLDLAAPDLQGTIRKLELLWEGQLHGMDRDSMRKLTVLDDLRRHLAA